ncbi:MAG: magnesium transporter [Deltaproteobacteria bacterium]|nr:magnesium transporter [Deltaproteobacteria bacterium]
MAALDLDNDVSKHVDFSLQLLREPREEHELSSKLSAFLDELHPVMLTSVINAVDPEYQSEFIKHVTGLDQLAGLIAHAGDYVRGIALKLLDDSRIGAVVRRLEIDDAADVLSMLPRRKRIGALKRVSPSRAKEINKLLAYDRETAGGIMTTLFLSFPEHISADEATRQLRQKLQDDDITRDTEISSFYILDGDHRLKGVCSLRELLAASSVSHISQIMKTSFLSVAPNDDQEKVARIIADYDLHSVPVLDPDSKKILGIITVDDIVDVIDEEHTEDLLRLVGTEEQDKIGATIPVAIKSRIPWLGASWLGGIVGAMLLGNFSPALEKVVALAFFMPIVCGMGGNVGSQTSTITVRGIATGELGDYRIFRRLKQEASIGILLGVIFGAMLCLVSLLLYHNIKLSLIVGVSIMMSMTCATSFGAILPFIMQKLGADPAIASGPFVTTSTDLISIVIYFSIASLML